MHKSISTYNLPDIFWSNRKRNKDMYMINNFQEVWTEEWKDHYLHILKFNTVD